MTTFKRLVRQESVISRTRPSPFAQSISLLFHNFPNFANREKRERENIGDPKETRGKKTFGVVIGRKIKKILTR